MKLKGEMTWFDVRFTPDGKRIGVFQLHTFGKFIRCVIESNEHLVDALADAWLSNGHPMIVVGDPVTLFRKGTDGKRRGYTELKVHQVAFRDLNGLGHVIGGAPDDL